MAGNTIQDLLVQLGMDSSGFEAGVSTAEKSLEHLGISFAEIAEGFSLSAALAGTVELGETFEQASIQIQRSTGLAGESVKGLEDAFADVYASSAQSSTNIAAALSQISIHTGAAGTELEALTQSALAFAKVTGSDVQTSVQQNERLFAQWGVATQDQSEALDMLYVASTKSGVGTQQLASEMQSMGPVLQSFGFSFESSLALVATFEKAGLDASSTVQTLAKAFKTWADAHDEPNQKLSELVAKIHDAGDAAEGMQIAIADGLTGRGLIPFVNAAQRGAFETGELQNALDHAKGSVKAMADGTDTLAEHWTKLWRALSEGIGGPAEQFLKWAGDALGAITELLNKIELFPHVIDQMFAGGLPIMEIAHLATKNSGAVPGISAPIGGTNLINPLPGNGPNSLNTPPMASDGGNPPFSTDTDKMRPMQFEDQPLLHPEEWERLQEAVAKANAEMQSIGIKPIIPPGWLGPLQNPQIVNEKWNEATAGIAKGAEDMLHPLGQAKTAIELISKSVEETAAQSVSASFAQLADAAKFFGMTSSQEYQNMAAVAAEKFQEMKNSGLASDNDLAVAALKLEQIQIEAAYAAGQISIEQFRGRLAAVESGLNDLTGKNLTADKTILASHIDVGQQMEQASKSLFSGMENDLAKSIVDWKGWGSMLTNLGRTWATDLLKIFEQALFNPLENTFASVMKQAGAQISSLLTHGGGSGGVVSSLGLDPLITALGLNTASTTVNTTGTVTNTASTVANTAADLGNTAATIGDTAASALHAASQIAALLANTATTAVSTATESVTSTVSFASETANTAAEFANTAALGSLITALAINDVSQIFGFAGGGNVESDMVAKLHTREMVLPPNIADGLRNLIATGSAPSFAAMPSLAMSAAPGMGGNGFTLINPVFHGVTEQTVDTVMNLMVTAARRAGVKFSPVG